MKSSIFPLFIVSICLIFLAGCKPRIDSQYYKHPTPITIDTKLVLPPAWAFGVLYGGYTDQQGTIDRIREIKAHDYPIDAYWIDSWFWSYAEKGLGPKKFIDFVADTVGFPNRPQMWDFMEENNIKGGFWIWDCILQTGNEKAFDDFNSKGFFSNTYIETGAWHNYSRSTAMFEAGTDDRKGTLCGNIDFENPQAVKYFKERMKHFFDEGADFIKLDRTSKISVCKTMFEMSQEFGKETKGRGFVLSHSFETENEEYKRYPTKWTDDTRSDWTVENPLVKFNPWVPNIAFKENIAMFTDPKKASSKIPFLTNDLGGFDMGLTSKPEEELFIRWLQFSMFNPITEVFSQPENPTANMAWLYSERADSIFRQYAHLRMELFPYIYSYALRSRIEGKHMLGKFPEHIYQYTFGDELLVAPVYEKGAVSQKVFLPEGKWINYWTDEHLDGNAEYVVAAPISQIPLFVKQGSVIPMRKYAPSIEKGTNDTIRLHIYPGDNGCFNLLEDDGSSKDYLDGIYSSTIIELNDSQGKFVLKINPVEGNYNGMSKSRIWLLYIHSAETPKQIRLNRKNLKFSFDTEKKIAIAEISKMSGKQLLGLEVVY